MDNDVKNHVNRHKNGGFLISENSVEYEHNLGKSIAP